MNSRLEPVPYYSVIITPRLVRSALTAMSLLGVVIAGSSFAASDTFSVVGNKADRVHVTANPTPLQSELQQQPTTSTHHAAWLDFALPEIMGENDGKVLLSDTDADAYRRIFALQADGNWEEADKAIASLTDTRLMGHVKAQRYLHPEAYKATYVELRDWLKAYSSLQEADRIHALANRRRPQGEVLKLSNPSADKGISGGIAAAAVMGSGDHAAWDIGLKAWKERDYNAALSAFRDLARNEKANPWDQAAGAFWTARCLTRLGQPSEVSPWLRRAAAHSRTFYGLLASRQLGLETSLNWETPELKREHLVSLSGKPAGHRALALLQIGQLDLAEGELRSLNPRGNEMLEQALVAVASQAGLPNLALRLGTSIPSANGALYDAALYPMPHWQPEGGFRIDRALVFALVRQESRFEIEARSQVGATGLMQLMPTTASYVAGREFDRTNIRELHDPELNLALGQRYVQYLLEQNAVKGNLFYMLAAYNSGPGQFNRWKSDMATNDPLLFIESLPNDETRDFVQRVAANYWIYQLQMNQATPSLDAVASGDWPLYTPSNEDGLRVADNVTVQ